MNPLLASYLVTAVLAALIIWAMVGAGRSEARRGQDMLDRTPVPPQPYRDGPVEVQDVDD